MVRPAKSPRCECGHVQSRHHLSIDQVRGPLRKIGFCTASPFCQCQNFKHAKALATAPRADAEGE